MPSQLPPTISVSTNYLLWKLCAWAGPLFLVGALVSFALIAGFVPPPRANWSAQQVTQFYLDNSLRIRVGMVLTLTFLPFYVVFSAAIARVMQRIEGPAGMLHSVELLGGFITIVITGGGLLLWLAAGFRTGLRTPQEVMLLNDLAWLVIDVPFMGTALQYAALATVFLLDRREQPLVPRWVCWLSCWVATIYVTAALVPFFVDGPFSWHGLFSFYVVYAMFFVWIVPVSYYVIRAVGRLEREAAAAAPG